jgi:hypothetical protein
MKQKTENPFDTSIEEYIKALESLDRFLARDRVMSSPKSKKLARKGEKQGYISLGMI